METSFAALLFRPAEVPDRILGQACAVALAGWDAPAPHLLLTELSALPGWTVAFYRSGARAGAGDDELDHACELFEDDLAPGLCVRAAAADLGAPEAVIYAITFSEDFVHDDAWRFDKHGVVRRFVREGEEGLEAGVETPDSDELRPVDVAQATGVWDDVAVGSEDEEGRAVERAVGPHRGSEFLARELSAPVRSLLMGALFSAERRIEVRLVEPGPASVTAGVSALNRALRRRDGRGVFAPVPAVHSVPPPAAFEAFVCAYDWEDPQDPADMYRELAIGRIEGTLRFLRAAELSRADRDPVFAPAARAGFYPVAGLRPSAPGAPPEAARIVALAGDGDRLALVGPHGAVAEAGPTLGELLLYLALGWKKRSDWEDEVIAALMLRARVRVDGVGA